MSQVQGKATWMYWSTYLSDVETIAGERCKALAAGISVASSFPPPIKIATTLPSCRCPLLRLGPRYDHGRVLHQRRGNQGTRVSGKQGYEPIPCSPRGHRLRSQAQRSALTYRLA